MQIVVLLELSNNFEAKSMRGRVWAGKKILLESVSRKIFISYPYECHMDLCNESCLSFWQASQLPCRVKTFMLDITHKLFNLVFHTCYAQWHHWLLSFYITFIDLDHCWGLQGQLKAKPVRFIFYYVAAIQAEHPGTIFEWDLLKQQK